MKARLLLAVLAVTAACAPRRINEQPVLSNGDRVPTSENQVEAARGRAAQDNASLTRARDSISATALASCTPALCESIARGVVMLGMTEAQVQAATRTTGAAWSIRDAADASVMTGANPMTAPRDAIGELAMVQLRNGKVSAISYREAQGIRVVMNTSEATTAGRASAMAEMLVREGDDLVARGDMNGALNRYDRAQVLHANDPQLDYRIATILDKQLRPMEALIRYQLFLHKLELEKIKASGDAYAQMATAIAHAKERIIVLEKQTK